MFVVLVDVVRFVVDESTVLAGVVAVGIGVAVEAESLEGAELQAASRAPHRIMSINRLRKRTVFLLLPIMLIANCGEASLYSKMAKRRIE